MTLAQRLHAAVRNVSDFPKPGIQFKDITPILSNPVLLKEAAEALAEPFQEHGVTKVVAIESRGFILGSLLATYLGAGFVPVRKAGKLPYRTVAESYELEYGTDTIEMHVDAVSREDRVLIHDDVIATGGTAAATQRLVHRAGADVFGFAFLAELDALGGRDLLHDGPHIHTLLHF